MTNKAAKLSCKHLKCLPLNYSLMKLCRRIKSHNVTNRSYQDVSSVAKLHCVKVVIINWKLFKNPFARAAADNNRSSHSLSRIASDSFTNMHSKGSGKKIFLLSARSVHAFITFAIHHNPLETASQYYHDIFMFCFPPFSDGKLINWKLVVILIGCNSFRSGLGHKERS